MNVTKPTRRTLFQQCELLSHAAALAAHALEADGFRQRDLKFYLELFGNWLQYSVSEDVPPIANMQVARYVRAICREGLCKELKTRPSVSNSAPRYRLTRVGMVELLREIVSQPVYKRPAFLFFIEYFIGSYRSALLEMIKREGSLYPAAMRIEVESLLDLQLFRQQQRHSIKLELSKLEQRITASFRMAERADKLLKNGSDFAEVARRIEHEYPYELNSQKPLSGLLVSIGPERGKWELVEGGVSRAKLLWGPLLELWKAYLKQLDVVMRES